VRRTEAASTASAVMAGYHRATVLAFILCGLLTIVSLFVPPGLNFDPGIGMLEWRTLVEGGPSNSIVSPDPADISKDRIQFITWWSPGQYLIPGVFTVLGLRLGPALSLTAGLSLLCCLLGWIRVLKHFAFSPQAATLAVVLLAAFPYSTINFRIYDGGDILLQGVTPWLILAACHVPVVSALRAAGLAGAAILIGFFAKLTGVMVAGVALIAGSLVALMRLRRITTGMVAGATGAIVAVGLLYATWFSRGPTAASGSGWTFQSSYLVFAVVAPWGAGVSWMDLWESVLSNPARPMLRDPWFLLPPVALFAAPMLWGLKRRTDGRSELSELIKITACFYAIYALTLATLYMHGGNISIDERHFRSAGTLIFVCALGVADGLPRKDGARFAVGAFCGFMSLYGVFSFVSRAQSTDLRQIDPYSRTRQLKVDVGAVEYARAEFAREGRDALFVLPFPDAASAFPPGARLVATRTDPELEPEARIAARKYAGRVPGPVYVLMRTRIARTAKGTLLLKEFTDYPPDAWDANQFGDTTVFVQQVPAS
jgi:hypothetical protein